MIDSIELGLGPCKIDTPQKGAGMIANPKLLRLLGFIILPLLIFGWPGPVGGQSKDVLEGAKKEGQLVFYSGIPIPDAQAILSAFERKYRFIKLPSIGQRVQLWYRASKPSSVLEPTFGMS
jgi:hypothetical protein